MSHTFRVSDKIISEQMRKHRPRMQHWLKDKGVRSKVKGETLYASDTQTIGGPSPLFHTISRAFNNHLPMVLTPDAVWLTILTGLTHHIDTDPEGLRHHFVAHEGKKILSVDLGPGSIHTAAPSQWEYGISEISKQLDETLNPKKYDLLVCNFSTTTALDKLSSKVALMGAMKHWFEYKMMFCCGFTKVTIDGTPEDWEDIINRVGALSELNLSWWVDQLLPILQEFKQACGGSADTDFWERAYLEHSVGSGGDFNVSGWINTLYPYVNGSGKGSEGMMRNPYIKWEANATKGLDSDDFPFGLTSAPLIVDDNGTEYKCELYGGLVGVSMVDDFTVRPESGAAIQLLGSP